MTEPDSNIKCYCNWGSHRRGPSGEHVLNVLARLESPSPPTAAAMPAAPLTLAEEPLADVDRYERLRSESRRGGHPCRMERWPN